VVECFECNFIGCYFPYYNRLLYESSKIRISFQGVRSFELYSHFFNAGRLCIVEFSYGETNEVSLSSFATDVSHMTFVVPPGEPYTALEKMFIMFDMETWIAIITFLIIGLVTIGAVNLMSRKAQDFVYGRNVITPTMNMFEVFLCGAQVRLPGRNFARFLLMMFIIWCLIIRTC